MMMPEPIHQHSTRERIVRMRDPIRQPPPPFALGKGTFAKNRRRMLHTTQYTRQDGLLRIFGIAASQDADFRWRFRDHCVDHVRCRQVCNRLLDLRCFFSQLCETLLVSCRLLGFRLDRTDFRITEKEQVVPVIEYNDIGQLTMTEKVKVNGEYVRDAKQSESNNE